MLNINHNQLSKSKGTSCSHSLMILKEIQITRSKFILFGTPVTTNSLTFLIFSVKDIDID